MEEIRKIKKLMIEIKNEVEKLERKAGYEENKELQIAFKVKGKDTHFIVDWDYLKQLEEIFPDVNVKEELYKMKTWYEENPKRQKVKVKTFINNWLTRSRQNNVKKNRRKPEEIREDLEDWKRKKFS